MLSELYEAIRLFLSECKTYDYIFLGLLIIMGIINLMTIYHINQLNKLVALTDEQIELGEQLEVANSVQWFIISLILLLYIGIQYLVRHNVLGFGTFLN